MILLKKVYYVIQKTSSHKKMQPSPSWSNDQLSYVERIVRSPVHFQSVVSAYAVVLMALIKPNTHQTEIASVRTEEQ